MTSPWYQDPRYQQYWNSFHQMSSSYQSPPHPSQSDVQTIAYWRSLALGLQYENQQLHSLVSQLTGVNLSQVKQEENIDKISDNSNARDLIKVNETPSDIKTKKRSRKKKCIKAEPVETSSEVQSNNNDDDLEEYLKFAMETERHRKERDAAGVNGDVKKDSRTRCDEDIDLDLAEKADNIVVDHERLKREMSELFGADALKVHTNISHHHN